MCAEHRSDTIREIRTALREGRPCRVVSTQLVEAGVDLDFPVVYRAIAGIDSLVQSAGRCNREGRAQHGMLHVFDSGDQEKLKGWLARTAALGKEVIGRFSDFLSPEAVREYFSRLYSLEGELDTNQIVKTLQEGRRTLDFPFESISNEFHFIEENSIGVVVPYKPAVIDPIIESICSGDSIRTNLRRIQRHVVQIPFYSADRLKKDGMVVPLTDDLFLLTDARHYQRERCGLVLDSEDAGPLPTLMI